MLKKSLQLFLIVYFFIENAYGLYPFATESRSQISLNGIWYFKVDYNNEGIANNWQEKSFKTQVSLHFFLEKKQKNINLYFILMKS